MTRTFRRPYRKSRAIDRSCRCHGGCPWCMRNRMHATRVREQAAEFQVIDFDVQEFGKREFDELKKFFDNEQAAQIKAVQRKDNHGD
jgi:hypothetical protein